MTSCANVIILSSSPIPPSRSPTRIVDKTKELAEISPQAATPPSIPSPSELFHPPLYSRFFDVPTQTGDASKKKRQRTKKTIASGLIEEHAPNILRQEESKAAKELRSNMLGDLEPQSLDPRTTVAKKTTGAQISRSKTKSSSKTKTKSQEAGNMTLAGKVTKGSNNTQTKSTKKAGKKTAATKSPRMDSTDNPEPKASNTLGNDEVLQLDEAMRRRTDWTPPRETSQPVDKTDDGSGVDSNCEPSTKIGFNSFLSDYNYSGSGSDSREVLCATDGGPTKRRRIELVGPQCQPMHSRHSNDVSPAEGDESSLSSSKAQPKKQKPKSQRRFTTLTARMTAQYTSNDLEEDPLVEDITQHIGKSNTRRNKKKSKEKDPELVVLSPEAAFQALDQQDVVFGTCSQLERDDSPETLREMQQAISASEILAFEERATDSPLGTGRTATGDSTSRAMSRLTGARNLWGIAGRDTGGSLVQAKNVHKVDLPDATQVSKKKDTVKPSSKASIPDDDWFDLDYGTSGPSRKKISSTGRVLKPTAVPHPPASTGPVPPAHGPEPALPNSHPMGEVSQQPPMPRYCGFTDAELSKQVATYGFKSVRGRKKMIELLQKCWESKYGKATQPLGGFSQLESASEAESSAAVSSARPQSPTAKSKGKTKAKRNTSIPTSTDTTTRIESVGIASPKRTKQQHSKARTPPPSSYIDVEEIQDSEEEAYLSPSQVQKRYTQIFSKTTASAREPSLDLLTKELRSPTKSNALSPNPLRSTKSLFPAAATKTAATASSTRNSLLDISTQITEAVRAQPASGSRSRPTWHEKILMYDPIILEDFTTWLNVEGLGLVGEDREVGTASVREWCEGKGICCCWKKNASW
ncbi:uncharacterized protein N7482_000774 [Penicillium canariense]|uniref:Structure-specific endonuclease subunit SLX4 n=1 Tax=Penicillium canariense TaxID=189055 RepID=A0A9W9IEJ9_9EURO|nr:uncharacterized protein N7482_000774 [Penicillium canariense]KAJ5174897.1 hypothetical protein N7482_000774 [Penicillium canariense]